MEVINILQILKIEKSQHSTFLIFEGLFIYSSSVSLNIFNIILHAVCRIEEKNC